MDSSLELLLDAGVPGDLGRGDAIAAKCKQIEVLLPYERDMVAH